MFVNAPHILKPVDIISLPSVGFEMEGSSNADSEDPTLVPRRWWKANPEQTKAVGLKESLMALRDVLKGNRFDVGLHTCVLRGKCTNASIIY